MNVKKTEDFIDRLLEAKEEKSKKGSSRIKRVIKDMRLFSNSIKQTLGLMEDSGYETEYIIDEQEGGCEILIKVSYGGESDVL